MTGTTRQTTLVVQLALVVLGLAAAAGVLHAGDIRYPRSASTERMLYLRSGRTADRLMLSFDALAADVYWIRTIQHYGRDRKSPRTTGRFELLYPLLDLTTSLDPYFNIAYRFGAIFLAQPAPLGPDRVDQAIALLQKGLSTDPTRWRYALDIGFIYYWYGSGANKTADFGAAAQWFDRAAGMPGAPIWLQPLAAVTRAQGGDRNGARRMLGELAQSEEAWIRRAAERGLQQVQALDDLDALQGAVNRYVALRQAPPADWSDLVRAGLLGLQAGHVAPADPAGVPYEYDATTRTVRLSPQSPLGPLPRTLAAR
jgi:hypothetical protein